MTWPWGGIKRRPGGWRDRVPRFSFLWRGGEPGMLRKLLASERGAYGGIEMLFILGVVGVTAMLLMNNLKSGVSSASTNVTDKLTNAINAIPQPQ
ncbi:MAG: hypothetical protein ACPLSY_04825 [Moorellaceae bacterium]